MVRAESVTATLVYTYTADGLRVAQAIDGDVTTFAWDWASGVPEMLRDGTSLYLIGHDTLGRFADGEWAYHLPDALGSVRQVVDGAGSVASSREWTPFGVEVGVAQMGLGYTGEWSDPNVGLTYLRARWYSPQYGIFLSRDPIKSEPPYQYVRGNPINRVDPSGLCAQMPGASTDCERFVAEVEYIIAMVKKGGRSNCFIQALTSDEALVVDFLAWYYSGIPFSWQSLYASFVPLSPNFEGFPQMPPGIPRDRYRVPDWPEDPRFEWNHPILDLDSPEGQVMRANYGFKRAYFEQTHHYFAFLKFAYYLGGPLVRGYNRQREIEDQLEDARRLVQGNWGSKGHDQRYRFIYREAIGDLYLFDQAAGHALAIAIFGIDILPDILRTWCAENEADVWSLEGEIDVYYFDFPREYWPEVVLEGWPEG